MTLHSPVRRNNSKCSGGWKVTKRKRTDRKKRSKVYTFKTLKIERGWPYSRQHTYRLIKAGLFPAPMKAPGGKINLWGDEVIDDYFDSL
jgi:hypothetical protein